MALLNLTRLVKKDFFTETLWNDLMDILEAKFNGGVSEADLTWPLVAQGNIDMSGGYSIVGLKSLWGVVNAGEYANLEAAIAAASGAAIFIPPDETINCSAATIGTSDVTIFGAGPTSVIKITAAGTGPMISTAAAGVNNFRLMNVQLDGTGAGAGCVAMKLARATRPQLINVYISGFTGKFVQITNDGTPGNSCVDVLLDNVQCSGGGAEHVYVDDVQGLGIFEFVSRTATSDAIRMVPAGATNLIQDVMIDNARVQSGGAKGISIVGSGAAGIVAQSRIHVRGCHAVSMTGIPFEIGNTAALLKDIEVVGNYSKSSTSDGIHIAADGGTVTSNHCVSATGDGIDITNSASLFVQGNNCASAGAYGINCATTTSCRVIGNDCSAATTDGINRTGSTNLRALENLGDDAPTVGNVFADFASYTRTFGSGAGAIGAFSYTIPANSLKTGDVLRITARVTQGGGGSGTVEARAGGTGLGGTLVDATDNTMVWLVRILQTGAGTNTLLTNTREGAANVLVTNSSTIDWTTDLAITFQATAIAVADIVVNGIFIELLGSK